MLSLDGLLDLCDRRRMQESPQARRHVFTQPDLDWDRVHRIRALINVLEASYRDNLKPLYAARVELIKVMTAAGMGQREVGAYWGVSNPRITQILKRDVR